MKKALIILFLFPILAFGQQKKGYFSFSAVADILPDLNNGYGLSFTGNGQLAKYIYLGGGIGFTKFDGINQVVVPIFGNITIVPSSENKPHAIIFIQPGYGVYNNNGTKGGFYFNGDLGIGFPGKAKPFLAFGYSSYTFTYGSYRTQYGGPAVRFGARFK